MGVPVLDRTSCPVCRQGHDPEFEKDNARETVLDLQVPRGAASTLIFDAAGATYRRALLGYEDLALSRHGRRIKLVLPPQTDSRTDAAELSTRIVEPGLSLRLEHDDPLRRDGDYRLQRDGGPMASRRAATQLEFAMRQAARTLGLGGRVEEGKLGTIHIMGFDTNDPGGHRDAPAHVHMHLRWPDVAGTQIAHYYLDEAGTPRRNRVSYQRLSAPDRWFEPGETFTTVDRYGQPVYSHTIGTDGTLTLADGQGRACRIGPASSGFAEGAQVDCDGALPVAVRVDDDLATGTIRVRLGDAIETWHYDPDSGRLIP